VTSVAISSSPFQRAERHRTARVGNRNAKKKICAPPAQAMAEALGLAAFVARF